MSTLILLAAKPSRLRLEKLLYESRTFQTELPSQQLLLDEQVRPLIFQKRKIDEKLKKFSTLKTLAEADQQWLNLIKALSGEQRQVEENQYEAEADNENGTIWLVEKEELSSNLRWWKGPPWLSDETMWPTWTLMNVVLKR
ncbi:unnamed protein product [Gongylonema pulchrum]|uniref:Septum formation inhibitor Maf n=1 Tax=Gongylonema pulchrum TaxID=637853 RepID=A0A183CXE3_9BILA|nr:unnamed protein product [Gongylonema pulchrum]